jgi:hypothetical protein
VRSSVVTLVREDAFLPSYTLPSPLHSFSSRYNLPLHLPLALSPHLCRGGMLFVAEIPRTVNTYHADSRETTDESCSHARQNDFFNTFVLRPTDIRQPASTCQYIVLLSSLRCDDLQYVRWTCYDVRSVSRTTLVQVPGHLVDYLDWCSSSSYSLPSGILESRSGKYDIIQV